MRTFIGDIDDSEYEFVSPTHDSVESFVSNYCNRTFESTSYTRKKYCGNGRSILILDDYPLTAVDRVSIGNIGAVKVKNTNTTSSASVSVVSTGLRLVKDGVADTSVTFVANTTMTAIINAINAISGWSAELLNSSYGSYRSADLIESVGLSAINNNWVDLKMPDDAEDNFSADLSTAVLKKNSGWPSGFNNIYIDYTAGYTSTTMPEDLKLAIKIFTKYIYNKKEEETIGVAEYRAENLWGTFEKDPMGKEVRMILSKYKRMLV
ncbi:MAG: hypothetical protein GQ540_03610 [Lutibacter sp.]|uniref:hypothetical protein n=1 Tax=Lutibacter sp. TaxID=1925666 RepID=UPI0019EAD6F5|nr:hypothetical protein [Lutibacter sp.]NOR27599.1 hypothetical protein [Lutibacter sp.]